MPTSHRFPAASFRRHLRRALLAAVSLAASGAGTLRAAESRVTFAGSLAPAPVVAGARTAAAGRVISSVTGLSETQLAAPMEFSVALAMRNLAEFQARIGRGELVPYEEVQAKYAPLQADYDRVAAWLKGQGFTLTFDDTSRLSVFARGTVAQIQTSFGVTMQSVTVDGVAYTSAVSAPSLPAGVTGGVLGVNGLQPHLRKHTHHRTAPLKAPGGKTTDTLTDPTTYPYTLGQIRSAYNGTTLTTTAGGTTTTLDGSGQKIAILIDAFALHSDLTTFWNNNGVAQTINNLEEVNVPNGPVDAAEGEETLDESWSGGIAPGARVRVYCSDDLYDSSTNKCLSLIQKDVTGPTAASIAQPQLHALSMSYGGDQNAVSNTEYATEASYYATIANGNKFFGGVSIFASSGDDGSQQDEARTGSPTLIVSYPAADVSITGVGGTDLYYSSTAVNGRNWTERGWGEQTQNSSGAYAFGGSGGGAATTQIPRPNWQVGTGVASGSTRLVPDVSAAGGPTYAYLVYAGQNTGFYGTSWSSPTWAGFASLVNQARALQGQLPLGQLNRRVYPLIGTASFYDTTTGNNSYTTSTTGPGTGSFSCTVGYDEVTGVGTPNLSALVSALTGPTITGFSPASGAAGTSVTITGTNFYPSAVNAPTVTFNGTAASSVTVNGATQITAVAPSGVTTGPIVVTSISDAAMSPTSFTVGGATAGVPTITGFSPASGAAGTSVTITGTNLTGATAVTFNGTAGSSFGGTTAAITSDTTTQIVATVPTGASTGTLSVTTAGGTATSAAVFTAAAPTITGFSPTSGPAGTSVTLTGTNLAGAVSVYFNGTAGVVVNGTAATITSDTATQIVVTAPTGAVTGTINVSTAGGTATSAAAFTVTSSGGVVATTGPIVISQVYGGNSSNSSSFANDYVELFNPSTTAVNLSAYSVQYAPATSATYAVTPLTGVIPAQHYFLVQEAAGGGTGSVPAADVTGTINLSGTAGKVALVSNQTALSGATSTSAGVVDYVGYGTTANVYEGSGPAPAPSTITAIFRANGGYTDTNNNAADFTTGKPNPHNSTASNSPDLTVALGHAGSFTQADAADTYTITVGNGGTYTTSGTVSVADTLPGGLTATGLSGTGWTAAANHLSATRADALAAGGSYPALTLTVSVSSTAAASVTNSVTASGGGETNTVNDTATDPTTITALTPSQSWRYQYFGTTANSGNAADTANPSGDGLPNLLKYALGLDPTVPTATNVTVDGTTGYLRLTVPKNANAIDVTYTVQVSGDLTDPAGWMSGTTVTTMDTNTSTSLVVHDNTPIGSTPQRFMRLMISR